MNGLAVAIIMANWEKAHFVPMLFDVSLTQLTTSVTLTHLDVLPRLDGKQKNLDAPRASTSNGPRVRGIPDYDYQIGYLRFLRNAVPKPHEVGVVPPCPGHTRWVYTQG